MASDAGLKLKPKKGPKTGLGQEQDLLHDILPILDDFLNPAFQVIIHFHLRVLFLLILEHRVQALWHPELEWNTEFPLCLLPYDRWARLMQLRIAPS